jgi:alpha-tubulin suppressor-like RCC1 family protein
VAAGSPGNTTGFTYAIKNDGTLWGWGYNGNGQLGLQNTTNYSSPKQVGLLTNWSSISAGGYGAVAIKTDGTLWAWGWNVRGQLGNGTVISYSSPIQIGALTNWKQAAMHGDSADATCAAIKTDGTLWTWGANFQGQLGLGSVVSPTGAYVSSPVQVGSLTNWKQVAVGWYHVAAIKTDGTLWTWGGNFHGQLGLGSVAYVSSPVQVGSLTNWKQVTCNSFSHTLAVKTDGTLWAWGGNFRGQLGISAIGFTAGSAGYYSSPVQVGSLTNWKQLAAGYSNTAAVKTDGTLWNWGDNSQGQLGQSNIINYSSPVQVGSLTNWKQVAHGFFCSGITFSDLT